MALSDLSYVTRTVIELLNQSFILSDAWQASAPAILPEPPSRIANEGLGFYLYHIQENAAYKNIPPPGLSNTPIRFTPLALNLYYQLSANSTLANQNEAAYDEQTMMGIAMKALHDHPEITDDTRINNVQVMHSLIRGRNNLFKISLQAMPYTEAIQYWTAGTSPVKLSAYYELTVVLLEPATIDSRAGRVLAYGIHTFVQGAPQLSNSQNILNYTIPGEPNPRRIKVQPAQAPPLDLPSSRITFWGSGLQGDLVAVRLLGRWESWKNPEGAYEAAVTDASWNLESRDTTLSIEVQETALLESGNAVNILPGIYGVQISVTRNRLMPDGQNRAFVHLSNQCPITITPRIDTITAPGADNFFTVAGYGWQHPDLDSELVQVYLGTERLTEEAPNALNPGEFATVSLTELRFRPLDPPTFTTGQIVPLRIFVNGTESPPRWITIP